MKKLWPLLLVLFVALAVGCGDDEEDEGNRRDYSVQLRPLNNSGAEATAQLSLRGDDQLVVRMRGRGLERRWVHGLAVFGGAERARCPSATSDENGDDVVDAREARSTFGSLVANLTPWPSSDRGGDVDVFVRYEVDRDRVEPLQDRVLVLEGKTVRLRGMRHRGYIPTVPVACGRIARAG
jgi:hypothetical protein